MSYNSKKTKYNLNETGEFIIENYNSAKPFSSFFPGIAGVNGIPMWVFYVNRGQCICSMGVKDKDHAIMEFLPANRAYNLASSNGFRTFIKLPDHPSISFYEPFQNYYRDSQHNRTQRMIIAPAHLRLEEENHSLGLKFRVDYFTVPQDKYAGLIRTLRISNLGSETVNIEGLDGLPVIVPYGVDNFCLKNMRRTIEAFVEVCNMDNKVPFFKGKVEPSDRPNVRRITKGNFYLGFATTKTQANIIKPIVDPSIIFGSQTDFSFPERFVDMSLDDIIKDQILENQLPCAMGQFRTSIPVGESYTYSSIIGHVSSLKMLNEMLSKISRADYINSKAVENRELIEILTQNSLICSSEPALDHYVRQNFLDNSMRGGFPITLTANKNHTTLYLYSRKHGDMERDYNEFSLTPTQYSQGNGNYRDINQNRRSDLFLNPDIGKENVEYFYNLIQLDGFNPLVLKEVYYVVDDNYKLQNILEKYVSTKHIESLRSFINKQFTPGELLAFFDKNNIILKTGSKIFLGEILNHCQKISDTDYGESYWVDHWTYNLDLLENYQAVYPEKLSSLLFEKKVFSFYDNPNVVQPRDKKYVLWNDKPMQLGAIFFDEEKAELIENRNSYHNKVRTEWGRGEIYYTTLFCKILCLVVNKLASLDPDGVGVEMDAGKPGWYDALNGLPGLFGSSICETLEIKRHILFLLEMIDASKSDSNKVSVFEELKELMDRLFDLLDSDMPSFEFWDAASTAKELYREKTRLGMSGKEITVELARIKGFFKAALIKLDKGIENGWDKESKTLFTYFRYEITDFKMLDCKNSDGLPCIKPLKSKQIPLPLFLEGPVHYLRCLPKKEKALEFAANIKKSTLYDNSLNMYKVNTSLANEPKEIGRARVFSPGWLENESIWLHMEYKYMLELLRNELYEDFYNDFKNVFIPFMDPDIYGRSILENSSFIASSAHPNQLIHGNGFVARLTGATAEFIHILLLMTMGPKPFRLDSQGKLQFGLKPSLPGWIFSKKEKNIRVFEENQWQKIELPANSFSFMLFGKIFVTFHNKGLKNTFGEDKVCPVEWKITGISGDTESLKVETLSGEIVNKIRDRKISRIDIQLR